MIKQYIVGRPGGPSGPFWSVVGSDGELVAMQVTSEAHARRIADALNGQVYSHRNGETEPPGVEGWYWYELESDDWRIVEVDNGGVYEDSFAAYYSGVEASSDVAYMRGRWYGPIPEPVQEARHDDDA